MGVISDALTNSGVAAPVTPLAGGKTDRPLFNTALSSFQGIQKGATERLSTLRGSRGSSLQAATQPRLEQLSREAALAERSIGMEGSLANQRRAGIEGGEALGAQDIEMQELGNLVQQEGGLQQIDTQFTSIINEMASNAFANEMAGLQEAMNVYMTKEGAALDAASLAANARGATMDMYGRFAQAAGMEFGRNPSQPNTPLSGYQQPAAAGDMYMPAYQRRYF